MNTWKFIAERFPFKATLPLTAILALGPMSGAPFTIADGAVIFTTLFLTLLALRMADDLASIDTDRITHPDRGLPSGRIDAAGLTYAMATVATMAVVLNLSRGHFRSLLFLAGVYTLYFLFFRKIPVLIKPFLSNLVFGWIPPYVAATLLNRFSFEHLMLGLFAYGSAIAHEYAHSVHAADEASGRLKTYASLLGPRRSAILSLLMYVAAGTMGLVYWSHAGRPVFFLLILMVTTIRIIYLEIRLIDDPGVRTARPFYIAGFGFFLFPYSGLIFDNLVFSKVSLW